MVNLNRIINMMLIGFFLSVCHYSYKRPEIFTPPHFVTYLGYNFKQKYSSMDGFPKPIYENKLLHVTSDRYKLSRLSQTECMDGVYKGKLYIKIKSLSEFLWYKLLINFYLLCDYFNILITN